MNKSKLQNISKLIPFELSSLKIKYIIIKTICKIEYNIVRPIF